MDLPPDNPGEFLRALKEGSVGLEFNIDRGGTLLSIWDLSDELARIRACRALVVATAIFGGWTAEEASLEGASAASAARLRHALRDGPGEDAFQALLQLATNLRLFDPGKERYLHELDFRFAGAYQENPLHLRFLAFGAVACVGLCVTTLAAAQLKKEWDAPACRAQVDAMARAQFDMLQSLARLEGKWTERHAASHRATVDAAHLASSACGSLLSGIEFRLHLPPGIDYELKFGSAPPGPGPGCVKTL